jgi:hypothetical protein
MDIRFPADAAECASALRLVTDAYRCRGYVTGLHPLGGGTGHVLVAVSDGTVPPAAAHRPVAVLIPLDQAGAALLGHLSAASAFVCHWHHGGAAIARRADRLLRCHSRLLRPPPSPPCALQKGGTPDA